MYDIFFVLVSTQDYCEDMHHPAQQIDITTYSSLFAVMTEGIVLESPHEQSHCTVILV